MGSSSKPETVQNGGLQCAMGCGFWTLGQRGSKDAGG